MAEANGLLWVATSRPAADTRSAGKRDPYIALAAAILAQAAKDAKAGDIDAAAWLLTEQAEFLAGAVGLSWTHVQRWAQSKLYNILV